MGLYPNLSKSGDTDMGDIYKSKHILIKFKTDQAIQLYGEYIL